MEKLSEQRKNLIEVDLPRLGASRQEQRIERCLRRELWVIDGILDHEFSYEVLD